MFNFKRNNTRISPMTYKLGATSVVVSALFLVAGQPWSALIFGVITAAVTILSAWFDSETNN